MTRFVLAAILSLAAFTVAAPAQTAELPLTPDNAALVYWPLWSNTPERLQETVDATFNGRDLTWTPDEPTAKALADAAEHIDKLLDATRLDRCDFGLDYTKGPHMQAPHLEKLRATSRLLVADTRRLFDAGVTDPAIEHVRALFRLARQTAQSRLIVTSSIAVGFTRMACDEVLRMTSSGKLSPAQSQALQDILRAFDPARDLAYPDALRHEGRVSENYIRSAFTGADAGQQLLRAFARGGEPEDIVTKINTMDARALADAMARVRAYFNDAADAWNAPDAVTRLRALEQRVVAGEYSPLAVLLVPGLSALHEFADDQQANITNAIEHFAPTPAGPAAPK